MTDEGMEALRVAVTLAKDRQVRSLHVLRSMLQGYGFEPSAITEAVRAWADYEQSKSK